MAKKRPTGNPTKKEIENLSVRNIKDFEAGLSRIIRKYNSVYSRQQLINKLTKSNNSLTGTLNRQQQQILNQKIKQLQTSKRIYDVESKTLKIWGDIKPILGDVWKFFDEIDSTIKTSALNLGLSRSLSDQYRENLLSASKNAAKFGMSISGLAKAQEAYNTEVGTSLLLSQKSLDAVVGITQGTALSADETGTLVGQFKLLGKNATNTKDFVNDTAIVTSKLGLNLNKVLKDISGNFRLIQSYNFSNGINGVQKMAMYANMYKLNIESAFASIDKARTLEGAVEMSAKLMVMGGEFTKQNMFELGFMARNKPEEFINKMAQMTKGTYFFNKQTGEFQASAFDLDRLRAVSEATNIPFQELTQTARRLAEIDLAKSQMIGLSKTEMDFVANMAEMGKDGKFSITLGRDVIDIRKLSSDQIKLLQTEKDSLETRAKDALTFNQEFATMIEEFKTIALPFIKTLNSILRSIQSVFGDFGRGVAGALGVLFISQIPKLLTVPLSKAIAKSIAMSTGTSNSMKMLTGAPINQPNIGKGAGMMGGFSKMAGGALAVGGAFLAASYGIKMIAESFKELDPAQLDAITKTIVTMGIAIPASLLAIAIAGKVAEASAFGLGMISLVFATMGLAAMGMGKGVEFATTGISKLLSSLTPEVAESINKIGWGLGQIGLGLASFAIGSVGMVPFIGFLTTLKLFSGTLNNLTQLSTSMSNGTEGFKEFGNAITKISSIKTDDIKSNFLSINEFINKISENKGVILNLSQLSTSMANGTEGFKEFGNTISKLSLMNNDKTISNILSINGLIKTLGDNKGVIENLGMLTNLMANGTEGFKEFGNAITKVSMINNDKTLKELRQLLKELNEFKPINPLNEIKEIFSKPLQVEFTDKDVSMTINLTAQLDGREIASTMYSHLVKLGINKSTGKSS